MPNIQDISRSKLIWGFKFLVIGLGVVYIDLYFNSISKNDFLIFKDFSALKFFFLMLVLSLLSIGNWSGEIKKWQVLVGDISLKASTKQSLIAHSLALFTPQKLGEYGSKCLFYNRADHLRIIALTGVGHLTQLLATLGFGVFGVRMLYSQLDIFKLLSFSWLWVLLVLPIVFIIKPVRQKFSQLIDNLRKIERLKLSKAIFWSLGRYLIFSHQFFILLRLFDIQIPYINAMAVISLVYLFASILPVFALADALVKGSVALTIFSVIGYASPSILVIAFLMWVFNVMLPAILGYVWMLKWQPQLLISKS